MVKDILSTSTAWTRRRTNLFRLVSLLAVSVNAQRDNPFLTVLNSVETSGSLIIPTDIQQTSDGHLWSTGTAIFSPAVDEDLFFGEVANGTLLSTIRLGGIGHDVISDSIPINNSLVFAGWSSPTISNSSSQAIIGQLATDSRTLSWFTAFGGNNSDVARSMVVGNGGGYVLCGYTSSFGAGGVDGTILTFDDNGNRSWSNTLGEGGDEYLISLIKTNDNGYAAVGSTNSNTAGGYDMCVYKFDSNGNVLWTKRFGGMGDDGFANYFSMSIIELANGHLKIVGTTLSFGAEGKAIMIVEFDNFGNLVSAVMVDGPGDEEANALQKTKQGIKLAGYTTSYGLGNPKRMFVFDMYVNNTLSSATTFEGSGDSGFYSDAIYGVRSTNDGGYAFTGTYNQSGVVAKSDIYGEFPSNCTTHVVPSIIDITANITVSTPNITAVPFTPTIFNVTFIQKSAPIVVENPCLFTTPSPAPVPTPISTSTPAPTASSILSGSTSATTTLVTPISSSVASISSSTVSAISTPITFNVIVTTDPIVIESGTPTTLSINALSFTGNANPEQLVFTVLGNNPDLVITVDGVEGASLFTYAQLAGGFVSLELPPGMTCGQSTINLQLEATVAGSNTPSQQVNVPLLFEGTTCTTNAGRLLVFSRKQEPKQAVWPVKSFDPAPRFKY